jgi:SAM-dependent methyltransferase
MSEATENEIEGIGEPLQALGKESHWERYRLPVELAGKGFLDVGCWEGVHCAEAVRRGAAQTVGIDLCTSDDLSANVDRYGFEFVQMDVFSEKWFELDTFDVVLCSGLLFSVENVLGLLFRLRKVVGELLVVESRISLHHPEKPTMVFHGQGEDTANPTSWWSPNKLCFEQMLATAGFEGISTVWEEERGEGYARCCLHAVPTGAVDYPRLLPRVKGAMPLYGGNRESVRRPAGE